MNTYNINDNEFIKSKIYQDYLSENPSVGYLKIRAYAASQALPITNVKIVVSKNIDNNKVIFYEGETNESGVIEKISLPSPRINDSNLDVPGSTNYDILATYNNVSKTYKVNIYENIYVIQTINIVPTLNVMAGDS